MISLVYYLKWMAAGMPQCGEQAGAMEHSVEVKTMLTKIKTLNQTSQSHVTA